ncbi:hypothetical protein Micbo1qcDRAFT_66686 [Microdochium bolleyi]|uniref:Uncharacterized protein n=1 Tax=Microdochium bolleyi TaxID=196109 RepID=A0A136IK16_9PEZI|nr:hypothetical protein Micbo1qcDRAFT_66686 [Microdochium bolleyi]
MNKVQAVPSCEDDSPLPRGGTPTDKAQKRDTYLSRLLAVVALVAAVQWQCAFVVPGPDMNHAPSMHVVVRSPARALLVWAYMMRKKSRYRLKIRCVG